ncbi:MAG: TetR/AcrR family transcriptional regulator C-terminal domain-containing protein [Clostridia bacterium]|nr:TetR/AcrR family transcriptional regulator C-terminal domain-containing protein [Clostridia bacterium]
MKKQEYKNSIQTKKKIASAYLSLLIENPDEVNVTEIVKKAGLHRGTFYIHFENVKMVEQYIESELAQNFKDLETDFRLIQIDKTPETILKKLNEILEKDLDFYRLFIRAASNTNLMETIKQSILVSISNNFKVMRYVMNYERFKVVIQYITGGVIGTYTDWFKGNIDCTLEELSFHLSSLIKTGLKEFIQDAN